MTMIRLPEWLLNSPFGWVWMSGCNVAALQAAIGALSRFEEKPTTIRGRVRFTRTPSVHRENGAILTRSVTAIGRTRQGGFVCRCTMVEVEGMEDGETWNVYRIEL